MFNVSTYENIWFHHIRAMRKRYAICFSVKPMGLVLHSHGVVLVTVVLSNKVSPVLGKHISY